MAKKKLPDTFDDELDDFVPETSISKLPANPLGGKVPLSNFAQLPTMLLHPYESKDNKDFHPMSDEEFNELVESIEEYGIMEPIIVRPRVSGEYEILSGEHRWKGAKTLGLDTVPCNIQDVSDEMAAIIFSLTNLIRRDMTYSDRINGWKRVFDNHKAQKGHKDIQQAVALTGSNISLRTAQYYAKMASLIPEFKAMMDAGHMNFHTGYQVAFLEEFQQKELLPYASRINEDSAKLLRELSDNGGWSAPGIEAILTHRTYSDTFRPIMAAFRKTIKAKIKPEYLSNAAEIMDAALENYLLKEHPEYRISVQAATKK